MIHRYLAHLGSRLLRQRADDREYEYRETGETPRIAPRPPEPEVITCPKCSGSGEEFLPPGRFLIGEWTTCSLCRGDGHVDGCACYGLMVHVDGVCPQEVRDAA